MYCYIIDLCNDIPIQRWSIPAHSISDVKCFGLDTRGRYDGRICFVHRNDHHISNPYTTKIQIYHKVNSYDCMSYPNYM